MLVGVSLRPEYSDWESMREAAIAADDLGYDWLLTSDHRIASENHRNGSSVLAGDRRLTPPTELATLSEDDLRARLELLAARGLGISIEDMEVVLSDFSERARPPSLENAILTAMRG